MRKSDPSSTAALEPTVRSLAVHPGVVAREQRALQMGGTVTWRHRQRRRTVVELFIASNHDLYVVTAVVF